MGWQVDGARRGGRPNRQCAPIHPPRLGNIIWHISQTTTSKYSATTTRSIWQLYCTPAIYQVNRITTTIPSRWVCIQDTNRSPSSSSCLSCKWLARLLQSAKRPYYRTPCLPRQTCPPSVPCLVSSNYLLFDVSYIPYHTSSRIIMAPRIVLVETFLLLVPPSALATNQGPTMGATLGPTPARSFPDPIDSSTRLDST